MMAYCRDFLLIVKPFRGFIISGRCFGKIPLFSSLPDGGRGGGGAPLKSWPQFQRAVRPEFGNEANGQGEGSGVKNRRWTVMLR